MNHFLSTYGLFLAETITTVIAILIVLLGIFAIAGKNKNKGKRRFEVHKLNDKFEEMRITLQQEILTKEELNALKKQQKLKAKQEKAECKKIKQKNKAKKKDQSKEKSNDATCDVACEAKTCDKNKRRIFVLDFYGDIRAAEVENLRQEVTAILTIATPKDEVIIKIESSGGLVHSYGLAASQIKRIRDHGIPLIAIVDKVAASGGYMMACVADRILAAPFAIVGSVGVITQIPNFNRFLKKHDIDFEQISAGEYKRTLTLFGENTNKGRQKLQEEVDETHDLFKSFVTSNRPVVNIDAVSTGEHWYGVKAKELRLIDDIITSDEYLLQASSSANLYEVTYTVKKGLMEKFALSAHKALSKFW